MKRTAHNHLDLLCTVLLSISLTGCYTFLHHPHSVAPADANDNPIEKKRK